MFEILYKRILGINYTERLINDINGNILRQDGVYEMLVKKYFYNKNAYKKILLILEKLDLKTNTELSFLAYIYALNHKWNKALTTMEKVIHLEKGENIDSWIDYGHFLRKIPKYENISNILLLNLAYYINTYSKYRKQEKIISITELLYE